MHKKIYYSSILCMLGIFLSLQSPMLSKAAIETEPSQVGQGEASIHGMSEEAWANLTDSILEYDEIENRIAYFNTTFVSAKGSYGNTLQTMEKNINELKVAYREMETLSANAKDNEDILSYQIYQAQAGGLKKVIAGMNKSLKNLQKENSPANRSFDSVKDNLTYAARGLMINYKTIENNLVLLNGLVATQEENLKIKQVMKQSGLASEYDVTSAKADLSSAKNNVMKLEEKRVQLYHALLSLCGYASGEEIRIAEIPEAEVVDIDSIRFEEDMVRAISSQPDMIAFRHEKHSHSLGNTVAREMREDELEAYIKIKFQSIYDTLKSSEKAYHLALKAYAVSEENKKANDVKKSLGLLSDIAYAGMNISHIQAGIEKETARLNLLNTVNEYQMATKGNIAIEE